MFSAYDNQSFYLWGGDYQGNVNLQNSFAQYAPVTNQWSLLTTIGNMPTQRSGLNAVVSSSGVAYIWGGHGDIKTGYSGPGAYELFDDMITFNTVQLTWNILSVSGAPLLSRAEYASIMLPGNKIVIIGGLTEQQVNTSYVNFTQAAMSSIPIFDTNIATWTIHNATGNVPVPRQYPTAVLIDDGNSILMFGGGAINEYLNDVAILDTMTMQWSQPFLNGIVPAPRLGASSVFVNGQMIIFFGRSNSGSYLNDVAVIDTRQTPYAWVSSFDPNLTLATTSSTFDSSPSSGLSAVGGIGGLPPL